MGIEVVDSRLRVVDDIGINASWDFEYVLSKQEWDEFCAIPPARGFTSAQAIVATQGADRIRGDRATWARGAAVIDRVLEACRRSAHDAQPAPATSPAPNRPALGVGPITGRYIHLDVEGSRRRIYFESAGQGPAIVCLHTAGADSRQYRYMLEDGELTEKYTVYAFDMPWHGRSDPPDDWESTRYALTTDTYAATVLSFIEALDIHTPILVGCSMGGAIGLYLAAHHGDLFSGVCALEGGLGNPRRFVEWTNRADVDHSTFLVSWVGGLIAPTSPRGPRTQTLWGYAQSGPGVYQGDTYFYSHDLPRRVVDIPQASCPLYVFSGEYDYSATTEMSRDAADRLGGELIDMRTKGHFPMSEDPVGFARYLYPVLEKISGREHG
ncbi:alpha/beta hydrolase [Gordonia sp. ABSL11-1]|uniref:alpha/beta fold hydrolase n=1 Tax=Gordonia sp. ABSL11-1 TaxID=3053924 RepID=UPI0025748522|nr:alpha/beta hydrolase [Gordonia sp. ABSL11-1]MDL9948163.1 alpha/beta hydrolase [Gordonia sp. ABSL11-1]